MVATPRLLFGFSSTGSDIPSLVYKSQLENCSTNTEPNPYFTNTNQYEIAWSIDASKSEPLWKDIEGYDDESTCGGKEAICVGRDVASDSELFFWENFLIVEPIQSSCTHTQDPLQDPLCSSCDSYNSSTVRNWNLRDTCRDCVCSSMLKLPCACPETVGTGNTQLSAECIESDPIVQQVIKNNDCCENVWDYNCLLIYNEIAIHKCVVTTFLFTSLLRTLDLNERNLVLLWHLVSYQVFQ